MRENGPDILIVEDSEGMLWAMGNILESHGFVVDAATSGSEALERLSLFPQTPLMVVNYVLPDMNGISLMRRVRSWNNGHVPSVVAVTAFATSEVRGGFLSQGAYAVLEKPFDIRDLVRACREAMGL